jgi:beta-glucosidase
LWAFGHGLTYSGFALSDLTAQPDGKAVRVGFTIRNTGKRAGNGVAQVYVAPADWKKAGWEAPKRLGAFAKAELKPGRSKHLELSIDPRLFATYEAAGNNWRTRAGVYRLMLGEASDDLAQSVEVTFADNVWSASYAK